MARRAGAAPSSNAACLVRLQKDFEDLTTVIGAKVRWPNPKNLQEFVVRITPEVGIWHGGNYDFKFTIPDDWPIQRPDVRILTRIWHPNIEELPLNGVCLNILRKNYTPATRIVAMILGLQFLFAEPNPGDPLNFDAAQQYLQNYNAFKLKAEEYKEYCPKDDFR